MNHDAVKQYARYHDAMKRDAMNHAMNHDAMKQYAMNEDAVNQDCQDR